MNFRFLNPLATIASLKDEITNLQIDLSMANDARALFLSQRNAARADANLADTLLTDTLDRLYQHVQAIDAFMAEREELKQDAKMATDSMHHYLDLASNEACRADDNEVLARSLDEDLVEAEKSARAHAAEIAYERSRADANSADFEFAMSVADQLDADRRDALLDASAKDAEIVEIVSWVKAAEAALAKVGLEVWLSLGSGNERDWHREFAFWKDAGVTHVTAHTTFAMNHHKRIAGHTAADHLAAITRFKEVVADLV